MKISEKILIFLVLFPILGQADFIGSLDANVSIRFADRAWAEEDKDRTSTGSAPDLKISRHPNRVLELDTSGNYVIGQGDVLEVFVWRNENLSRRIVVRPDGKISLPLLQDVQAEGLTVIRLRDEVARRYSEYVNNPRVTVIVSEINSFRVSVLGRVANPGVYPVTGNTTLIEVISMAGGFTEWANKRRITVITREGGKEKKITVNYKKIISGKDPRQNIILKRGDTIIVP
jgi:polysaccharide export outer membrane protein